VADVVRELERAVVDPHREPDVARDEAQLLAVARDLRQLAGDQREDLVEGGPGTVEDGARADVHVGDPILGVEERAVECAQVVHREQRLNCSADGPRPNVTSW
jgi:hypothetical protein